MDTIGETAWPYVNYPEDQEDTTMKTVSIKGKDYVEVNERLKYFREHYPTHSLVSKIFELTSDRVVMSASVLDESGNVLATGHAYEKEGSTFINKTSFIENCETSAWGRALGNFGIGIDTSIASAQEVQTAIINQNEDKPETNKDRLMTKDQKEEIGAICEASGMDKKTFAKEWGLTKNTTESQAADIIIAASEKYSNAG